MASNTILPSEVITLEGTGENNADPEPVRIKTNVKSKKHLKYYPYFSDPAIVPRVKQYLEDNKDKVYIDIDQMVSSLRRRYRDYAKKKTPAFKAIVEKAFQVVLHTYSVQDDTPKDVTDSSESEDMDIDSEEVDLIEDANSTNDHVINMYIHQQQIKKHACPKLGASNNETKELIDISSDDADEDEVPSKRSKHADSTNCNGSKTSPPNAESQKTNGQATPEEVEVAQEHVTTSSLTVQAVNVTNALSAPMTVPAVNPVTVPAITPVTVAAISPVTVAVAAPVTPSNSDRLKRKRAALDSSLPSASATGDVPKKRKRDVPVMRPCCTFKDVGGCSAVLQEVCKLLVHLRHPEVFEQIGVSPPRGFLLHGPPGCGKSLLANAIAGELGVPLLKVAAPELIAGVSGESEERIRDLFDQAVSIAPCVLFLDEIDAITPNRNNAQREMERRIVAQLLTTLDELGEKEGGNQVLVVGATNRPDSLDPALRRAGRFDREICMGIPDREARVHILKVVCGRLALASDVSSDAGIEELASLTPGFVGADLTALTREAAMVAINRIFAQLQDKQEDGDEINTEKQDETSLGMVKTQEHPVKVDSGVEEKTVNEVEENAANEVAAASDVVVEEPMETDAESKLENLTVVSEEVIQGEGVTNSTETAKPLVQESSVEPEEGKTGDVNETDEVIESSTETSDSVVQADLTLQNGSENKDLPESNEKAPCDEINIEVLEETTEKSSQPSDDKPVAKEMLQKDLELSQKLLPSATWSPQLSQIMSWLKDTPPLTPEQLNNLTITKADFHEALRHVQPSSKREGFATVPDVTWDDVGSLANVRAELQLCVLAPVRYSRQFSQLGLNAPAGVLLCGPPGCGKTLLAKAVANEAGINFISVKGPEVLNMYVGESERAVRQVFQRARNSAPCVIFFDELDALCPKRSDLGDNGVSSRVVNQLLTEMDGVEGRAAVFLMAASNRPDIIDPAVLRPGRLDKVVYVGLPNKEDRKDILRALTKNGMRPLLAPDVDLAELSSRPELEGYSGADLAALVREAGVHALQEFIIAGGETQKSQLCVAITHFNTAAAKIRPSVTPSDRKHYEKLREKFCSVAVSSNTMDTA